MENKVSLEVLVDMLKRNYSLNQANKILCQLWEALPKGEEKDAVRDEILRIGRVWIHLDL